MQALPAGATLLASGNGVHLDKPSRLQQATIAEVLPEPSVIKADAEHCM